MGGSISFHNRTEVPLVFVISQVGPLFWGVLQPGESAIRKTGHVWFTIDMYLYDGKNEPTSQDAVLSILIPTATAIAAAVTAGFAAVPLAGSAAAALAPIVTSTVAVDAICAAGGTALSMGFQAVLRDTTSPIKIRGFFVGGDEHITVDGGPKSGVRAHQWEPLSYVHSKQQETGSDAIVSDSETLSTGSETVAEAKAEGSPSDGTPGAWSFPVLSALSSFFVMAASLPFKFARAR
eukprot:TRINITY_DN8910_c0_g1_i1.p1 TRINITY_DN8910_c0_g1~~TRINITY_DN8910_c0_g1_i1.p1  ORF type:complete len:236 (+),score=26.27 TRINITY_DN8910_c0_g1_i1:76-783(+)